MKKVIFEDNKAGFAKIGGVFWRGHEEISEDI